jgi:hypothetical protein
MTLNEILLEKLAKWQPTRDRRQVLLATDEASGWAVSVTADRHDDMSTATWELLLRRAAAAPDRKEGDLSAWAQRVTSQVTGLLEPLAVVEIDLSSDTALLRSQEPTRRGGELYYYEVLLTGISQASTRRFRAQPYDGRREQIPFTLTHEVLAKFAADLTAA